MFALNLGIDGRVLSATEEQFARGAAVIVDALPEGDIADFRYVEGQYIYDPVPVEEVNEKPSQLDTIEAQVTYTAMMTDTLLEV